MVVVVVVVVVLSFCMLFMCMCVCGSLKVYFEFVVGVVMLRLVVIMGCVECVVVMSV